SGRSGTPNGFRVFGAGGWSPDAPGLTGSSRPSRAIASSKKRFISGLQEKGHDGRRPGRAGPARRGSSSRRLTQGGGAGPNGRRGRRDRPIRRRGAGG